MSKFQLKKKLNSFPESKFVKRNRNGNVGINKANYYKHIPDAPRKRCQKCGNQNPLAIHCNLSSPKAQSPKALESTNYKPLNVLYKPKKPCYHCGSKFHSIYVCEKYHALYYDYYQPKRNLPYGNGKTVKSESSSYSDKGKSKSTKFNAKMISKKGSNLCWVPKASN